MVPASCPGRRPAPRRRRCSRQARAAHGPVHRHRHRHAVERNAVEQDLHVFDRVDCDARLADVADDARVVRVVAAVRREVEGDADALAASFEVAAVERVRLLRRRKARVLADGPRALRVHRRLRPAQVWREARERVHVRQTGNVGRRVERLDRNPVRRVPGQAVHRCAAKLFRSGRTPCAQVGVCIIFCHLVSLTNPPKRSGHPPKILHRAPERPAGRITFRRAAARVLLPSFAAQHSRRQ